MELQRNPFLINRALSKFLMASVFSAVAIQLAAMIDSIIVANFVGPDAMSAISVCMPVMGIIVNLTDYTVGADKGGAVSMFDDFDIDYNQQKYLMETRCSGALTKPYSAITIESYAVKAGG